MIKKGNSGLTMLAFRLMLISALFLSPILVTYAFPGSNSVGIENAEERKIEDEERETESGYYTLTNTSESTSDGSAPASVSIFFKEEPSSIHFEETSNVGSTLRVQLSITRTPLYLPYGQLKYHLIA